MRMIIVLVYLAKGLCEPQSIGVFIMTKQASATPATPAADSTLGNSAVLKPATKAEKAHHAQLSTIAKEISGALWGAAVSETGITPTCRKILKESLDDAKVILSGVFADMAERAKPDPLDTSKGLPTDKDREDNQRQAELRKHQFKEAGNKLATQMRQAAETLPLGKRPIVSIQIKQADLSAVVTVIPAGTSKADIEKALEHDKRALTQVLKRVAKEQEQIADDAAKAASLPAPSKTKKEAEAKAKADAENAGHIVSTDTGRPLSEFAPLSIMVALLVWPADKMRELSAMLNKQADGKEAEAKAKAEAEAKQAKAEKAAAEKLENEAKAKASATADGKGAGANAKAKAKADAKASDKAKAAKGEKPAPVGAGSNVTVNPKAATPAPKGAKIPALDPKAAGVNIKPAKAGRGAPAGQKVDPAPAIAG